jgi:SAM-dependent methyltransferase
VPGYHTRFIDLPIGEHMYRLRVLSDGQQFYDPDGHCARLGISDAQWGLFGQTWAAGQTLAQAMHGFEIGGKRILELGCGIGLASLVLQRRGAQVIASDAHPLTEVFLAYNAALNALPAIHYRQLDWDVPLPTLGLFDLIIASDVLYERGQAEVVLTDPGRGNAARFTRLLHEQGFHQDMQDTPLHGAPLHGAPPHSDGPPSRERLLHFRRTAPGMPA